MIDPEDEPVDCPSCQGNGMDPETDDICERCGGTGIIPADDANPAM